MDGTRYLLPILRDDVLSLQSHFHEFEEKLAGIGGHVMTMTTRLALVEKTLDILLGPAQDGELETAAVAGVAPDVENFVLQCKDSVHAALLQRVNVLERSLSELTSSVAGRAGLDGVPNILKQQGQPPDGPSLQAKGRSKSHESEIVSADTHLLQEYQWEDSVYDTLIFAFLPYLGRSSLTLLLMLLINMAMVFVTVWILSTDTFTSPPFSDLDAVWAWRMTDGQSVNNMDPVTHLTLVSRVCAQDPTLSIGTYQQAIFSDIVDYQANGGRLLANVAVTLWVFCCASEMRKTMDFLTVIWSIPRTKHTSLATVDGGGVEILGFSLFRALLGSLIALIRFGAAAALMIWGSIWLAYTTSTTDLLLNASALGFVLEIDNEIFEAAAPYRIISLLKVLKPVIILKPRVQFFVPKVIVLGTVGFMIYANFELIDVVSSRMQLVRDTMCKPNRQMVIGMNPLQWRTFAYEPPQRDSDHLRSVLTKIIDRTSDANDYAYEVPNSIEVMRASSASLHTYVTSFPCEDMHTLSGATGNLGRRLWGATGNSTFETLRNCQEARSYCFEFGDLGNNVRFLCPVTCGCSIGQRGYDNITLSWDLATAEYGCPEESCVKDKKIFLSERQCKDGNLSFLLANQWDLALDRMKETGYIDEKLQKDLMEKGCVGVKKVPRVKRITLCSLNDVAGNFHGFAPACPRACSCTQHSCEGLCPRSCCPIASRRGQR